MNQGIKQFNYPVKDLAQAKKLYSTLLGIEPYMDKAYEFCHSKSVIPSI